MNKHVLDVAYKKKRNSLKKKKKVNATCLKYGLENFINNSNILTEVISKSTNHIHFSTKIDLKTGNCDNPFSFF